MATDTSLIEDDWVLERGDGSSEAAGGGAPVAGGWGGVTAVMQRSEALYL